MWYKEFWFKWLIGISLAVAFVAIGVLPVYESWNQHQKEVRQEELMAYVEKSGIRKEIEAYLKRRDPNAFTAEGKIKSYILWPKSIKPSSTSSMSVGISLNDDENLFITLYFLRYNGKPKLSSTIEDISVEQLLMED